MADVSSKLKEVLDLIEKRKYFIINRPRQYGKTTTLYTIADILEKTGNYFVANVSFEGVGDLFFSEEIRFTQGFMGLLASYVQYRDKELAVWLREHQAEVINMSLLSDAITAFTELSKKKFVLLIDEVDKSSNNQLFISF